jgi:hypothetical protein
MTDVFDPDQFINQGAEGPGSTSITPIPAGDNYIGVISNVVPATFGRKDGTNGVRLAVTFDLSDDDGSIKNAIDGREPKVTQNYFLDTNPSGGLDMGKGKNVQLNRLREAVNQNGPGSWNLGMLKGAGPLRLQIVQEPRKDGSDAIDNRVKSVGRIS